MMHSFPELTIGGVLIAPFVIYASAAIATFGQLRAADRQRVRRYCSPSHASTIRTSDPEGN
jgi:hypothetical protein